MPAALINPLISLSSIIKSALSLTALIPANWVITFPQSIDGTESLAVLNTESRISECVVTSSLSSVTS